MVMLTNPHDQTLAQLLRQHQLLSHTRLNELIEKTQQFQQSLFQLIAQNHLIDPDIFAQSCELYFDIPFEKITAHLLPSFDILPIDVYKNYLVIPLSMDDNTITLGIANPADKDILHALSFQLKKSLHLVLIRYDILLSLHNRYLSNHIYTEKSVSVKTLAEHILSDAIHRNASDIHLETYPHCFRVRYRLDGLLQTIIDFEKNKAEGILNCLKILAHLDIAVKRMPQDGKLIFHTPFGFYKNCRISTCPTASGEKMVIRLLDQPINKFSINELGLSPYQQNTILNTLQKPQGLILVTGPTGSGKTITLYSLLNLLNQAQRNIVTIEDPIEIQLEGINQTNINPKIGLTFSYILRTLLRQDPDVMMIGEIRDQETAEMAIRAAQTGHLVLSTLHTNSAAEALTRLSHMGISTYHISSAVSLIIAQRLVRKICVYCQEKTTIQCSHCHQGFSGRIGVFELLACDEVVKHYITSASPLSDIQAHNKKNNHDSLRESALKIVASGKTTQQEMDRVIA